MLSIKLIISIGMLNENFQVYEIKKLQNNIKVYSIGGLTLSEKTTHKMKEKKFQIIYQIRGLYIKYINKLNTITQ